MSEFEILQKRIHDSLAALAETQERLADEIVRGLILSTGMMRDLGVAIDTARLETPLELEP